MGNTKPAEGNAEVFGDDDTMIDEESIVIQEQKNKGGRPKGSIKPVNMQDLQQAELIELLKLSKKIRMFAEVQLERLMGEAEGISGSGNVAKLLESLIKSLQVVAQTAANIVKQGQTDSPKDPEDGKSVLENLLG